VGHVTDASQRSPMSKTASRWGQGAVGMHRRGCRVAASKMLSCVAVACVERSSDSPGKQVARTATTASGVARTLSTSLGICSMCTYLRARTE